jgi:hypothetical protein
MLPSANVRYQWTATGGPHIVDGTVSFDGGATFIDKSASYRVAMNAQVGSEVASTGHVGSEVATAH